MPIRGVLQHSVCTQRKQRAQTQNIEPGEFAIDDVDCAVFVVAAPLPFLNARQHAKEPRLPAVAPNDPVRLLKYQIRILLHGVPALSRSTPILHTRSTLNTPGTVNSLKAKTA